MAVAAASKILIYPLFSSCLSHILARSIVNPISRAEPATFVRSHCWRLRGNSGRSRAVTSHATDFILLLSFTSSVTKEQSRNDATLSFLCSHKPLDCLLSYSLLSSLKQVTFCRYRHMIYFPCLCWIFLYIYFFVFIYFINIYWPY